MIFDLFSVEDPVDHVAAEQSHFYLVSCVTVQLLVLVDDFEKI